jgi:Holliday junction resolvase RusA-like endonuclease
MRTVKFIIPGKPRAWKRHKTGRFGNSYNPSEKDQKRIVDYAFAAGIHGEPHQGPVILIVRAYVQRPLRLMREKDQEEAIISTSSPDVDNILKNIKDALNTIAYRDDAQIWFEIGSKKYHEKSEMPRTEVTLIFQ